MAGSGNSYTAEYWQYDTRLGRRWNIDPMTAKYLFQSPCATFNNNPIFFIDKEGEDIYVYYVNQDKQVTVAKIASDLNLEIELTSEVVPKEFAAMVSAEGWNPISYDGEVFRHMPTNNSGSIWGIFTSDAKMFSIALTGTAVIQAQIELDFAQ